MKKFLIVFGLLLLTGCSVSSDENISPEGEENSAEIKEALALPEGVIEKQIKDHVEAYWVDLKYPEWEDELFAPLNKSISDLVAHEKEEFEKQEFFMDSAAFGNYYIGSLYEITSNTPEIISIRFDFSTFSGGAHGMQYAKTINYSIGDQHFMTLDDMESEFPDFLKTISPLCREQIVETLGEMNDGEWLNRGTEPVQENFESFTFVEDVALEFTFDPYHVAAYAAGPQMCYIEWEELVGLGEQ